MLWPKNAPSRIYPEMYTFLHFLIRGKYYKALVHLWNFTELLTFRLSKKSITDNIKRQQQGTEVVNLEYPKDKENVHWHMMHTCVKKVGTGNVISLAAFIASNTILNFL